ncbi:HutD [compost metagenome]
MSRLEAKLLSLVPAQPWKNRGGVTRALAEIDNEWRVSLANVDANGPYSRFEGMTRLSLVIEGKGVVLHNREGRVALEYHVPALYDGALDWTASLIEGPVAALNIMARKDRYLPSASILTTPMTLPQGAAAVILSGNSRCTTRLADSDATVEIPPWHFVVVNPVSEPMEVSRDIVHPIGSNPPIVALIKPVEPRSSQKPYCLRKC